MSFNNQKGLAGKEVGSHTPGGNPFVKPSTPAMTTGQTKAQDIIGKAVEAANKNNEGGINNMSTIQEALKQEAAAKESKKPAGGNTPGIDLTKPSDEPVKEVTATKDISGTVTVLDTKKVDEPSNDDKSATAPREPELAQSNPPTPVNIGANPVGQAGPTNAPVYLSPIAWAKKYDKPAQMAYSWIRTNTIPEECLYRDPHTNRVLLIEDKMDAWYAERIAARTSSTVGAVHNRPVGDPAAILEMMIGWFDDAGRKDIATDLKKVHEGIVADNNEAAKAE